MTTKFDEEYFGKLQKCADIGIHIVPYPHGDAHHTDYPLTDQDKAVGSALACFLGDLFADVDGKDSRTPVDQWSRVARALRMHGLKVSDI